MFMKELSNVSTRLVNLDKHITEKLRTHPRQNTACGVMASKTYPFLPEVITNPKLRIAEFAPPLNPFEG